MNDGRVAYYPVIPSGDLDFRVIDDLEACLALHPESTSTRLILDEGIR